MITRIVIAGACRITATGLRALVPAVDAVAHLVLAQTGPKLQGAAVMLTGSNLSRSWFQGDGLIVRRQTARLPLSISVPDFPAVTFRDLLHAYRAARTYRRCVRLLTRSDVARERGDYRAAVMWMERAKVVLAGVGPSIEGGHYEV